jgi:hypothetical protein
MICNASCGTDSGRAHPPSKPRNNTCSKIPGKKRVQDYRSIPGLQNDQHNNSPVKGSSNENIMEDKFKARARRSRIPVLHPNNRKTRLQNDQQNRNLAARSCHENKVKEESKVTFLA